MSANFTYQGWDLKDMFISEQCVLDNLTGQELWGWGNNNYYALATATSADRCVPVQTISGGNNWKQVSAGWYYAMAIKTDGTLWGWGRNGSGNIGTGNTIGPTSPVQTISGGNNWKQVSSSACGSHTSAIKTDGTLWVWGNNSSGQLGDNTISPKSSPVQTISGGNNWKQVSNGFVHTMAIKTDGTLWGWGYNINGLLGDNTILSKSSPVQTVSGGTNWKQVSANGSSVNGTHTSAIKTDGTLWSWGAGSGGKLGDGTSVNRSSPVQIISGGTNWKQVSAGIVYSMAIKTDGTLWAWGYNSFGQLGDNTTSNRSSPVQVISGGTNWKQVSGGFGHTMATKTDGTLWAWGWNGYGQLGDGTNIDKSSPIRIDTSNNWRNVSSGYISTYALKITEGS